MFVVMRHKPKNQVILREYNDLAFFFVIIQESKIIKAIEEPRAIRSPSPRGAKDLPFCRASCYACIKALKLFGLFSEVGR